MHIVPDLHQKVGQGGRLIGYARVSTTDQKLDMQIDALKQAGCKEIFHDHGVSGAKAQRPGLDAALTVLGPGDSLVVYKLDRLGRSVSHLADLLTKLHRETVHFSSLTEGINTATPGGKLVFHVFAAVAEFHRDLIRENTRHGQEAARKRGVKFGRPRLLDRETVESASQCIRMHGSSPEAVAAQYGVSRSTLMRALKRSVAMESTGTRCSCATRIGEP